jgi:hypothetical protein
LLAATILFFRPLEYLLSLARGVRCTLFLIRFERAETRLAAARA